MATLHVVVETQAAVELDRCERCHVYFVDFDDGETGAILRALRLQTPAGSELETQDDWACPACSVPMQRTPYFDSKQHVLRCGECFGLVLTEAEIRALAEHEHVEAETTFWQRLRRALFG